MSERTLHHIGNVTIQRAGTQNPYAAPAHEHTIGQPRADMLLRFRREREVEGWRLWYSPWGGGAKLITADDVDWETSGVGD